VRGESERGGTRGGKGGERARGGREKAKPELFTKILCSILETQLLLRVLILICCLCIFEKERGIKRARKIIYYLFIIYFIFLI
jgi:hypothetical protein